LLCFNSFGFLFMPPSWSELTRCWHKSLTTAGQTERGQMGMEMKWVSKFWDGDGYGYGGSNWRPPKKSNNPDNNDHHLIVGLLVEVYLRAWVELFGELHFNLTQLFIYLQLNAEIMRSLCVCGIVCDMDSMSYEWYVGRGHLVAASV